jgi:AAHS family 3-hydroxyphenylpropionic acid transporter
MTDTVSAVRAPPLVPALVVSVCFCIAVLEGYDIQAIGVAAPGMAAALRLSAGQIGLAGSLATVGLVAGAVLGGWAADRWGRKPVLVASVAWFGAFSVMTAMAPSADLVLWSRLLTGLGFGGAMPNMIAVATEISSARRRAATVTAIFVGMPTGGAIAAVITRLLPHAGDWRLIFLIGGALPLLLTPAAAWLLPETLPVQDPTADRRPFNALFGGGRAPSTLMLWTACVCASLVLGLMLGWLPLLVIAKGLPAADGSAAAIVFNVAAVGGGLALGRLVDRFGPRWPLLVGLGLLFVGMALLALASSFLQVAALAGVAGFGLVGCQFCLYALAPRYYAASVRATGAGAAVGVGRIGAIAGPLIAGALRAAHADAAQVLTFTLPVIATAALALIVLTIIGKAYVE